VNAPVATKRKSVASALPVRAVDPTEPEDAFALGQTPLWSTDAEGAVLGALLFQSESAADRDHWPAVSAVLRAEHFYSTANQRVFEAITDLRAEGKPADPVMVVTAMRNRGTLQQAGGPAYVIQTLPLTTPATAYVELYARDVLELWRRRALIEECSRVVIMLSRRCGDGRSVYEMASAYPRVLRSHHPQVPQWRPLLHPH
jgi:replicative DNA helicase